VRLISPRRRTRAASACIPAGSIETSFGCD
jgi:hypothetical protein